MINRVSLVGRLTKDPAQRKTANGTSVATFTVACDRRFQGQNQDNQADFINCVAWRQSADFLSQYASKGRLVGVEGRIQTRSYDDQTGKRVYVTEVVCDSVRLLDSRSSASNRTQDSFQSGYQADPFGGNGYVQDDGFEDFNTGPTLDISSDDLPF